MACAAVGTQLAVGSSPTALGLHTRTSMGPTDCNAVFMKLGATKETVLPSELTAVSLASTDPTSLLQGFMSGFGGDGDDNFKFKMDSELSDVKLLSQDGTELPAEIVLLYEGQAVSFDVETTRRGLRAVNIAVVG